MATTTNFGWETPDDTDLVKDGAAAMRTLGNSIDTSFVDLKGGTTGQVLSKASGTDLDFTWVAQDDSNAIQNAIVDAKGDLIAATGADTPARLAVGTNGQVLTADSTAATGLAWATATSGGMTLLSTHTLSGSTYTISTINQTYKNLFVEYYGINNNTANGYPEITFNGGGNFSALKNIGSSGTVQAQADNASSVLRVSYGVYGRTQTNNYACFTINNYASTNTYKTVHLVTSYSDSEIINMVAGYLQNTAVSSIGFYNTGGTWAGGTVNVYGVK
jgi:hypothetical protein